jgi:hypothetical protein
MEATTPLYGFACGGNTWSLNGDSVGTRMTMKPRSIDWWQALHPLVNSAIDFANLWPANGHER